MNPLLAPIEITVGLGSARHARPRRDGRGRPLRATRDQPPREPRQPRRPGHRAGRAHRLARRVHARARANASTAAPRRSSPWAAGSTSAARSWRWRSFNEIGTQMLTEARLVHAARRRGGRQANEMVAVLPTVQAGDRDRRAAGGSDRALRASRRPPAGRSSTQPRRIGDRAPSQTIAQVEAAERIRTADPFITNEVLYQLSYGGAKSSVGGVAYSSPSSRR